MRGLGTPLLAIVLVLGCGAERRPPAPMRARVARVEQPEPEAAPEIADAPEGVSTTPPTGPVLTLGCGRVIAQLPEGARIVQQNPCYLGDDYASHDEPVPMGAGWLGGQSGADVQLDDCEISVGAHERVPTPLLAEGERLDRAIGDARVQYTAHPGRSDAFLHVASDRGWVLARSAWGTGLEMSVSSRVECREAIARIVDAIALTLHSSGPPRPEDGVAVIPVSGFGPNHMIEIPVPPGYAVRYWGMEYDQYQTSWALRPLDGSGYGAILYAYYVSPDAASLRARGRLVVRARALGAQRRFLESQDRHYEQPNDCAAAFARSPDGDMEVEIAISREDTPDRAAVLEALAHARWLPSSRRR